MKCFISAYTKIINEMAGTFTNEPLLFDKIKECKNFEKLFKNDIINLIKNDENLSKKLLNYDIPNLNIIKINLNDKNEIYNALQNFRENLTDSEFKEEAYRFIENVFNTSGAIGLFNKEILFMLNTFPFNKFTEKTIYHEFTHFIQPFEDKHTLKLNEHIIDKKHIDELKNIVPEINEDVILYMFNKTEFIPLINDFCYELKVLKNKNFKNLSNKDFLKNIVFGSLNNFKSSQLFLFYSRNSNDIMALMTFYASYLINYNFDKVTDIINDEFK